MPNKANTTRMTSSDLEAQLPYFTGTQSYTRTHPGLLITDGIKFLCDAAQCYWLLDIVWSISPIIKKEGFGLAIFRRLQNSGSFSLEDGNGKVLYHQDVPYTDFPLSEISFYVIPQGPQLVALLPTEY